MGLANLEKVVRKEERKTNRMVSEKQRSNVRKSL